MRLIWLLFSVACALITTFFCGTLVFYFMHYRPTYRVIALFSVVFFWMMLTNEAFSKFRRQLSK